MAFTISGRRHPRAGRSADAHYRDKLATWQKRVLPRMRWVLWPVIGLGLIGAWLPGMWKWAAGLWCGAAFALWIAWKDDAPARIDNWRLGAEGERKTERALDALERDGWYVTHDLASGRGNIDHVIVGPPGVFVLDSKVWRGDVSIDQSGVPTVTPFDTPQDVWTCPRLAGKSRAVSVQLK